MGVRMIIGDVFDGLAKIEDGSVDLCLTSPPFLALRSYLPSDHPDKGKEIGSEPTPEAFIDTLLDVVEAIAPKLAPHGSIAFELGDTYSGAGGSGGDYADGGMRAGQPVFDGSAARNRGKGGADAYGGGKNRVGTDAFPGGFTGRRGHGASGRVGWPLDKSLCLIPESFRWALVYGRNPFNGRTTERWRARNVIRWCRPNPPVGALGDKVRPATSELVVACKARDRWYDLDAIREPAKMLQNSFTNGPKSLGRVEGGATNYGSFDRRVDSNPAGAPPLDHWWYDQYDQDAWLIATQPYKGAHYATFPAALCVKPIEAMCPREVCRTCGEPRRRIVEVDGLRGHDFLRTDASDNDRGLWLHGEREPMPDITRTTVGWTDCDCAVESGSSRLESDLGTGSLGGTPDSSGQSKYRPGLVLDPFAGSGTTLAVAVGHGRDAIGIDLDARNADLARERCGMFLEVEGA